MSDALETGLLKTLSNAYEAKAKELGVPAEQVEKAEGLSVRLVSHIEKVHPVREEVSLSKSSARQTPSFVINNVSPINPVDVPKVFEKWMSRWLPGENKVHWSISIHTWSRRATFCHVCLRIRP